MKTSNQLSESPRALDRVGCDGSGSAFVVVAYRWGLRDAHSYVVGCYSSLEVARQEANTHVEYRGGKYGCEVVACATDKIAHDGNVTAQAHYAESPYFGLGGQNSPACQPADRKKPLLKQNAAYQPAGGEASTETKSNERKP
jgi:hypothetical protein